MCWVFKVKVMVIIVGSFLGIIVIVILRDILINCINKFGLKSVFFIMTIVIKIKELLINILFNWVMCFWRGVGFGFIDCRVEVIFFNFVFMFVVVMIIVFWFWIIFVLE